MKRVILAILLMVMSTVCYAETALDAIKALRRLDVLAANGTSYKDYSYFLGDAKIEVDIYLKGDEAKRNKKLSATIIECMGLYEYAGSLFSIMENTKGFINIGTDASPADKKIASEYFSRFPEDKKDVAAGGVVVTNQQAVKFKIKIAINKIFKRASDKYSEAMGMLK